MAKRPNARSYAAQESLSALMRQKKPGSGGVLHTGEVEYEWGEKYEGGDAWAGSGTSIFDPVLTELAVRWFCPPGGLVLDPFAGGSVRGIVSVKLGRQYIGVDLSERQLVANRAQAEVICKVGTKPDWRHGDSLEIERICAGVQADMILSCPPFGNLEVYSEHERDISTMSSEDFHATHAAIIKATCSLLKEDRFAFYVVGDYRDENGNYECFPERTVEAFKAAGLHKYNHCILVTSVGSLPVRTTKSFMATRKMGKSHQEVYVFVKGDARKAAELMERDDE